jgi:mortality factor 4-like protein 1
MPELLAHTNMDSQAMSKLRDHIEDFVKFLAKDPNRWIASPYESGLCTYMTPYPIAVS